MNGRQILEATGAGLGQAHAYRAVAVGVRKALDQSSRRGAIDQPDRAVRTQNEVAGDLADLRSPRVGVAPDGEEELVLGRGEAH